MQANQEGAAGAIRRQRDGIFESAVAEQRADIVLQADSRILIERGEILFVEFDHHALGAYAAAHGARGERFRHKQFRGVHQLEHGRIDRDAGFDATRQARRGRQFGNIPEIEKSGDGAHGFFVDAGFDERMAHAVVLCRVQTGAVFAEIVEVGAGDDLRRGMRHQRAVQVGLAVEAAVHRVAAIVRIAKFAGIDYRKRPAFARRERSHAIGGFLRHGGRNGVEHFDFAVQCAVGQSGQGQAVYAAADRYRYRSDVA